MNEASTNQEITETVLPAIALLVVVTIAIAVVAPDLWDAIQHLACRFDSAATSFWYLGGS